MKKIGKVLLVIALLITFTLGYRVWRAMQTDYSLDWEAAHMNHMVKIGSKLLICINATNYPDCEFQIRDSLDSEILEPFAAYYEPQYAYLAENARGIGVRSTDTFWPRYYLLLDYASLPEHYELEFVYQFDGDVRRYTLTKDAIAELFQ